jgi:cellulose synthase/poly-beta-1,6-N-acetylglucosamine synthase-like glycosyltransferase
MSLTEQTLPPSRFSVGICATGRAKGTPKLVEGLLAESLLGDFHLSEVVVVASECSAEVVSELKRIASRDVRLRLIQEDVRRGKADAINKILAEADGDLVVLVNSDAHPESGAVHSLLSTLASNPAVGVVSAMPVTHSHSGFASILADLMWATHNECSLMLNHMGISNHSSDELVAFRSKALARLPEDLVNDGAFMAATARRRGYSVKFSTDAKVGIETPSRVSDLIRQRRRILFGHAQVWQKLGDPPKTVESLLFFSPSIGLGLLVRTISKRPKFLLALPVAALTEFASSLLAVWDGIRSTKRHVVWRRFE